ncbi:hypothetical protein LPJ81_005898, partial [Coemansia sp. IMI 209127]
MVNAIMLPVTNLSLFLSNAQEAASSLELQINTEVSYINSRFDYITSVAMYDVNLAASDISKLLNSLYSFSQNGIQIMLSSPLLTMLPIVNPIAMAISAIIAADPVKMVTDYPAWQSEFSSRQAAVSNNYNTMYTFVSTGLPQAESMLLSIMSQISNLADHLTMHIGP